MEPEIGGGDVIYLGWPMCHAYLVSYATADKFVLVSDPESGGSLLRTKQDGEYLWTSRQILDLIRRFEGSEIRHGKWSFTAQSSVKFTRPQEVDPCAS